MSVFSKLFYNSGIYIHSFIQQIFIEFSMYQAVSIPGLHGNTVVNKTGKVPAFMGLTNKTK